MEYGSVVSPLLVLKGSQKQTNLILLMLSRE